MPKNNRNRMPPHESNVSLAQKAGVTSSPASAAAKAKKKKSPVAKTVLSLVLVFIMIVSVFVLIWGIQYTFDNFIAPKKEIIEVDLSIFKGTPEADKDKVAYYVVGLMGKDGSVATEALSVICHDKKAGTLNVLQFPQDTYLGEDVFGSNRIDLVWANPIPLDWCNDCKRKLSTTDINDGKHISCGKEIVKKTGSSSGDLCKVFNELLGLPVDEYFIFQQQSLVKLIDLFEGIKIELESDMSVGGISYKKGIQIITGEAALHYCTTRSSGTSGDIDRMVKMRKVFLAVFMHLTAQTEGQLESSTLGPVMNGSTPIKIRPELSRDELFQLVLSMKDITPDKITAYVMPGQTGKAANKQTYYSANSVDLLTLLNAEFIPAGNKLTEELLKLPQLGTPGKTDAKKQVMSDIAVSQD